MCGRRVAAIRPAGRVSNTNSSCPVLFSLLGVSLSLCGTLTHPSHFGQIMAMERCSGEEGASWKAMEGFWECTISVNTTPQMTRFRGAKVCSKWLQERIDDQNIQSDYKRTIRLKVQK